MAKAKHALRRFAVMLEYDGAAFAGWQLQSNARTDQAALERALRQGFGERRRVNGASRTDAGVHALGQVAAFDLAHSISTKQLVPALNGRLPRSIRVLSARMVPATWEPRKEAVQKTYTYLIHNRVPSSPFWEGKAWQVHQILDVAAMRRAAKQLVGKHDFTSFQASGCVARHPVRTLKAADVVRQGHMLKLRFTADAFLYHMVRNLAGTLVEVGKGRLTPAEVKKILKARNRKLAGPTAPAYGLYLKKIVLGRRSRTGGDAGD